MCIFKIYILSRCVLLHFYWLLLGLFSLFEVLVDQLGDFFIIFFVFFLDFIGLLAHSLSKVSQSTELFRSKVSDDFGEEFLDGYEKVRNEVLEWLLLFSSDLPMTTKVLEGREARTRKFCYDIRQEMYAYLRVL